MKIIDICTIIKTIITFTAWALVILLFVLIILPFTILPVSCRYHNRLYYFFMYLVSRIIMRSTLVKITIKGKENIPCYPYQPSIIAINHTSALDIPMVQMLVGSYPHIWLSKEEYSKIPFFGFILRRMNVLVKKGSIAQSLHIVDQAHEIAQNKPCHVLIFPEGMRHIDGKIHKFYSGFAVLAQKLNHPVIPIAIHGLHTIFPKKSHLVHSIGNNVTISIGKPMWYTTTENKQEFVDTVRQWFNTELEELAKNN